MQSVYFEFDLFCKYIPYLSKLYPVDKKQWKVGVRLTYDRHCTREDDSDLREKQNKTKQTNKTKENKKDKIFDHNWMGNSFHAENLTNTNKIKQETPKEPKSPYTDVDP